MGSTARSAPCDDDAVELEVAPGIVHDVRPGRHRAAGVPGAEPPARGARPTTSEIAQPSSTTTPSRRRPGALSVRRNVWYLVGLGRARASARFVGDARSRATRRSSASTSRAASRSCCRRWGSSSPTRLDVAVDLIEQRVNGLGVAEPEISPPGQRHRRRPARREGPRQGRGGGRQDRRAAVPARARRPPAGREERRARPPPRSRAAPPRPARRRRAAHHHDHRPRRATRRARGHGRVVRRQAAINARSPRSRPRGARERQAQGLRRAAEDRRTARRACCSAPR